MSETDTDRIPVPGRQWAGGVVTDDGDVYLLVSRWREAGTREWWGDSSISGEPARYVSVISRFAGGQVRGYWLDKQSRLWLSSPCYSGSWFEMDAAVAAALGATLVPYTILAGGVVPLWLEHAESPA